MTNRFMMNKYLRKSFSLYEIRARIAKAITNS